MSDDLDDWGRSEMVTDGSRLGPWAAVCVGFLLAVVCGILIAQVALAVAS